MSEGTNPKDLIGMKKVPLGLIPAAGIIHGAMAMRFGAFFAGKDGKGYGAYNWRDNKVIFSIYLDAIERHLISLRDGEDYAEDSKVHHLGHIIAGASIGLDAMELGNLVDDRPRAGNASALLARLTAQLKAPSKSVLCTCGIGGNGHCDIHGPYSR